MYSRKVRPFMSKNVPEIFFQTATPEGHLLSSIAGKKGEAVPCVSEKARPRRRPAQATIAVRRREPSKTNVPHTPARLLPALAVPYAKVN